MNCALHTQSDITTSISNAISNKSPLECDVRIESLKKKLSQIEAKKLNDNMFQGAAMIFVYPFSQKAKDDLEESKVVPLKQVAHRMIDEHAAREATTYAALIKIHSNEIWSFSKIFSPNFVKGLMTLCRHTTINFEAIVAAHPLVVNGGERPTYSEDPDMDENAKFLAYTKAVMIVQFRYEMQQRKNEDEKEIVIGNLEASIGIIDSKRDILDSANLCIRKSEVSVLIDILNK